MHQNLVTIVLMSYTLSKLYVDIKFDIFNMKFKNHLFYLIVVFIRIVIRYWQKKMKYKIQTMEYSQSSYPDILT